LIAAVNQVRELVQMAGAENLFGPAGRAFALDNGANWPAPIRM
jgi:hypothetical protein